MTAVLERNGFDQVVLSRQRPGFAVAPLSIAWNAVAFTVRGSRAAVACVPRSGLTSFLDDLDAGRLDASIEAFLASPPAGRILRSATQAAKPGLFDAIGSHDSIVPSERVPTRGVLGGIGGGTPADARRNKNRRGRPRRIPSPRALLVGATAVAVIGAGAAVAVSRSDDTTKVASAAGAPTTTTVSTTSTTTSTTVATTLLAFSNPNCQADPCGTWDVVDITSSGGRFPQTMHITQFDPDGGKFEGDVNESFSVLGHLVGDHATFSYMGGGYQADFDATFAGTGVGATLKGTWTDNSGQSGTIDATRSAL